MKFKRLIQPPIHTLFSTIIFGFVLVLSGCDFKTDALQWVNQVLEPLSTQIATPLPQSSATSTTEALDTAIPPTPTPELPQGPVELIVWVPPQFDPQADTPAAKLLRDRLNSFASSERDAFITIRIKAASGPSGMLEALSSTNAAAQSAVPALVLLPRSDLQTAALRKLIYPIELYSSAIDDSDWYQYARNLSITGGSSYGLPFAGDAPMLLYRPALIGKAPVNWDDILRRGEPLSIPAADPSALITMNLYASADGNLENAQRIPQLDLDLLTSVFQIYETGSQSGAFPLWITQFQQDAEAWTAYNELRSNWVITDSSRFLQNPPIDTTAVAFPALDDTPITLADGWVWCLSEPRDYAQAYAIELAEFLSDPTFLRQWTPQAGYLPVRPSSLPGWNNPSTSVLLGQVALSARVKPGNDVFIALAPVLQEQVLQIISGKTTAPVAAQAVLDKINLPAQK